MRHNKKYSCVHETIDEITTDNECMKFFLAPIEYDKKENVDVKWILTTGGEAYLNSQKFQNIRRY